MAENWIKLNRKFLEWEWYGKSEMVHLFLHLLLNANTVDERWQGMVIKRGQLVTSYDILHTETGLSIRTLRTCISRLIKTGEVEREATNKFSIITICNYESYQCVKMRNDKQETSDVQIADVQTTDQPSKPKKTKEQVKADTDKRMKDFYTSLIPYVQTYGKQMVREFYDYWSETNKSGSKMRWEQQPTWVLERRLSYWSQRDKNYNKSNENVNRNTSSEERARDAADIIARLAAEE